MSKTKSDVKIPAIEELFNHAMYFGHRVAHWNPKFKDFIFTVKGGIHIIDLNKTHALLKDALEFLAVQAAEGKELIVVATKTQAKSLVRPIFTGTGIHFVDSKWLPGLLSNFDTIKKRINYYNKLLDMRESGEMQKYSKKEIATFSHEIKKLENLIGGVLALKKLPSVMFIVDINNEKIALKEAKICHIPTVAMVDSNSDPQSVDFPIPANDDSRKSIEFMLTLVRDTWMNAKKA